MPTILEKREAQLQSDVMRVMTPVLYLLYSAGVIAFMAGVIYAISLLAD